MTISIHLLDHGRTLTAASGLSLLTALMRQGIFLKTDCGGKGTCGQCRVLIVHANGRSQSVNACSHILETDISIQIPKTSIPSSFIMDKAPLSFPDSFKESVKSDGPDGVYGVTVDIGTTTMAVYVCDIKRRTVLASTAMKNPQFLYGADVMSRITAVYENPRSLETMQAITVKSIESAVKSLCDSLKLSENSLSHMVVVGNPTMIHIVTKTNPRSIGLSPYKPAFYESRCFDSRDLSITLFKANIQTLPNLSGFLGGDILAAALAADMDRQPDGTLLIDLGTNGELVLKHKHSLLGTSCATGPAFEGATLACGTQAVPGAINAIDIDESYEVSAIYQVHAGGKRSFKPSGICGAGVIHAVARLLEKKIIEPGGAFYDGRDRFRIVSENKDTGQAEIYISQKDIRSVQLGKSALYTGIASLMKKAGIERLEKIIIAGAFGTHLNVSAVKTLGMIPDVEDENIRVAGNLAGSGAIMALCDGTAIEKTTALAQTIETVELERDITFQNAFIENLEFPFCLKPAKMDVSVTCDETGAHRHS